MDQRLGRSFYVGGRWELSASSQTIAVVNPATEAVIANATAGSVEDVNKAVSAARRAFENWSQTPLQARLDLLRRVGTGITARADDLAATITSEMGSPIGFSRTAQI